MTFKNSALLFRNCFPGKSQTAGDYSAFPQGVANSRVTVEGIQPAFSFGL
jgi:hypothetical protein